MRKVLNLPYTMRTFSVKTAFQAKFTIFSTDGFRGISIHIKTIINSQAFFRIKHLNLIISGLPKNVLYIY